jgi:hypothetical protein
MLQGISGSARLHVASLQEASPDGRTRVLGSEIRRLEESST